MEREYQVALAHLEQDLDGFLGASFVDVESGRTLAAHSVRPEFDLAALSASSREFIRSQLDAMSVRTPSAVLREILVISSEHVHLCYMISQCTFLFVVVEQDAVTLAMMKSITERRASEVRAKTDGVIEDVA